MSSTGNHESNQETDSSLTSTPLLSKNTLSHALGLGLMGAISMQISWLIMAMIEFKLPLLSVFIPIIIATVSLIIVFRKNAYSFNFSSKFTNRLSWLYVLSFFIGLTITIISFALFRSKFDGILSTLLFIFIYACFYRHFFEKATNSTADKIKNAKKDNIILWVCLIVFGFFTYHAPMLLMFYYLSVIFALPFYLFRYFLSDYPKVYTRISLIAIILFGVLLHGNVYLQNHLRQSYANEMLNEIITYKNQHGNYPTRDEIITKYKSANKYFVYYHLDKNYPKPSLHYRDAMLVFCSYNYDFDKQQWDEECRD